MYKAYFLIASFGRQIERGQQLTTTEKNIYCCRKSVWVLE